MALAAASYPGLSACYFPQREPPFSAVSPTAPSKCNRSAASSGEPSLIGPTLCWGNSWDPGPGDTPQPRQCPSRVPGPCVLHFAKFPLCPNSGKMAFGPVLQWARAERGFPAGPGRLCCSLLRQKPDRQGTSQGPLRPAEIIPLPQDSQEAAGSQELPRIS